MTISVPVVIPDERDLADAGGAETNSSGGALGVVSGKNINKRKKRWSNQCQTVRMTKSIYGKNKGVCL